VSIFIAEKSLDVNAPAFVLGFTTISVDIVVRTFTLEPERILVLYLTGIVITLLFTTDSN
jgi:hypothetical protein